MESCRRILSTCEKTARKQGRVVWSQFLRNTGIAVGMCFQAPLRCCIQACVYDTLLIIGCCCYSSKCLNYLWKKDFFGVQLVLVTVQFEIMRTLLMRSFLNPQSINCLKLWISSAFVLKTITYVVFTYLFVCLFIYMGTGEMSQQLRVHTPLTEDSFILDGSQSLLTSASVGSDTPAPPHVHVNCIHVHAHTNMQIKNLKIHKS